MSPQSFYYIFLLLPAALVAFGLARRWSGAGLALGCLLSASLIAYAAERPEALAVVAFSCLFNYWLALRLAGARQRGRDGQAWLVVGVLANLGLLAWFKYRDFLWATLGPWLGEGADAARMALLPLGISYFTFQQIAYLVDIQRGMAPESSILRYVAFVTFFPKIIAGPIVRPHELLPQLSSARLGFLSHRALAQGLTLFLLGLAKKTLLAGTLAPFADHAFGMAAEGGVPDLAQAWGGVLAYSLQLYFDFSGYSDMAIGAARMFGLRLPSNFNSPYRSLNISDFWRRWHMSLSRWLRDYLYIPLGGSRKGKGRRHLNVMITMLLCGLWHGTGWGFMVWGGLHGLFLVGHDLWRARAILRPGSACWPPPAWRAWAARLLTFLTVSLAWVFFRAQDLTAAGNMLCGLAGAGGMPVSRGTLVFMAWHLACGLFVAWLLPEAEQYVLGRPGGGNQTAQDHPPLQPAWRPRPSHLLLALILGLWALGRLASGASQFLYYQF